MLSSKTCSGKILYSSSSWFAPEITARLIQFCFCISKSQASPSWESRIQGNDGALHIVRQRSFILTHYKRMIQCHKCQGIKTKERNSGNWQRHNANGAWLQQLLPSFTNVSLMSQPKLQHSLQHSQVQEIQLENIALSVTSFLYLGSSGNGCWGEMNELRRVQWNWLRGMSTPYVNWGRYLWYNVCC